jgi:hypothetical protein
MALPDLDSPGSLPPGLHAASLGETLRRFGIGSEARQRQAELLRQVVEAATLYPTIKRVLVWGSFVTAKPEPGDLDYSIVVSVLYQPLEIAEAHRRFFAPFEARLYYGVDRGYLVIRDYPLEDYVEQLEFLCHTRHRLACGVAEISMRGEVLGETL